MQSMLINRRGFLKLCLAASAAPAIVRAESLMKIFVPPEPKILTLAEVHAADMEYAMLYGDGIHDDTAALQAFIDGKPIRTAVGITAIVDLERRYLSGGMFKTSSTIVFSKESRGNTITGCRFEGTKTANPIFYFDESFRDSTSPLQDNSVYMQQFPFNKKKSSL